MSAAEAPRGALGKARIERGATSYRRAGLLSVPSPSCFECAVILSKGASAARVPSQVSGLYAFGSCRVGRMRVRFPPQPAFAIAVHIRDGLHKDWMVLRVSVFITQGCESQWTRARAFLTRCAVRIAGATGLQDPGGTV